jgi:hypothetical protein
MTQPYEPSQPYLPPLVPSDNPAVPQKSSARKTLFIWLILVVLFIALYQVFSVPSHAPPTHAPESDFDWGAFATSWLPLVALVLFFVFFFRMFRGSRLVNSRLEPGQLAAVDGDLARARQIYLEVAKLYAKQPSYGANARCNAAVIALFQGDFDVARDELIAVDKTPGLFFGDGIRLYASLTLARLFAVTGDTERANAWLASSQSRLERNVANRLQFLASMHITRAILALRGGRADEAAQILERDWLRIIRACDHNDRQLALTLRAFLAAQSPRDAGAATPWLVAARSLGPTEIGYATKSWPELRTFVEHNAAAA